MPTKTAPPEGRTIVTGIFQELWKQFPDYEPEHSKETFKFHLCVFVDADGIGPLKNLYEFGREFGCPHIGKVFNGKPLPDGDLTFIYPDRYLSPRWARMFIYMLNRHPSILKGRRRRVLMVTMQPYLVSDCFRENVRIIMDPLFPRGDEEGLGKLFGDEFDKHYGMD